MCQFLDKTDNFNFVGQNLPKQLILESELQKTIVAVRISIFEIPCVPIFRRNGQLCLFGPKFGQKWILGLEFQKYKSWFGISPSKILFEPIFSQNGQLWIFWPKFGEIAELIAIFWFEYCWGCCREVGGGWSVLGGGRWS